MGLAYHSKNPQWKRLRSNKGFRNGYKAYHKRVNENIIRNTDKHLAAATCNSVTVYQQQVGKGHDCPVIL